MICGVRGGGGGGYSGEINGGAGGAGGSHRVLRMWWSVCGYMVVGMLIPVGGDYVMMLMAY